MHIRSGLNENILADDENDWVLVKNTSVVIQKPLSETIVYKQWFCHKYHDGKETESEHSVCFPPISRNWEP